MRIAILTAIAALTASIGTAFFCTPLSTESSSEESVGLRLSLELSGRKSAEFSGSPIEAIVELDRDTSFGVLHWHTGQGDPPRCLDTVFTKSARRFSVLLFWTRYPLVKDSSDGCYYDTVWVSMGGGLRKSNKVTVKVTNLPVVVDSGRLDSCFFWGEDTVWSCSMPVRLKETYQFNVYARDLDRKSVFLQVIGNKGKIIRDGLQSLSMKYQPPDGDFIDTIRLIASDQRGGQSMRTLFITHITPNIPPFIDSILVKNVVLKATSAAAGMYRVGFPAFDTLQLRVFAHDSSGSVRSASWRARSDGLIVDSTNSLMAVYICSGRNCRDTLMDSSVVVDTITVTVFDNRGDSTVRHIELSRGKINQPPAVRKIIFGNKTILFSDTSATVTATGGFEYPLRLEASDPERRPLTVTWYSSPSSRLSAKTDSTARYAAPARHDTDTVRVTVSDSLLTVCRTIIIIIDDIIPIIDSIKSNSTVFKGKDDVFSMAVSPRDTLLLTAYATDLDGADSMSYVWTAGKEERFGLKNGNRARYILPDTSLKDTIVLTITDGTAQTSKKIVINPANRAPVVDSIQADGRRLPTGSGAYRDTAVAGDTVEYRAYARDPDGDALQFEWNAADTSRLSSRKKQAIEYACTEAERTDTLTVKISDGKGESVNKKIIIVIDKR